MSTARMEMSIESRSMTPLSQWIDGGGNHQVQFYEEDSFLIDGLSRFIGATLATGDSALVIATKEHRDALCARLRGNGLDVTQATREGRFLALDVAETLAQLLVDGQPDPALFEEIVGGLIGRVAGAALGEKRPVAVFGEIVALLWRQGNQVAAIRLEQLWNQLAATHSFHMHCAYPMSLFSVEGNGVGVEEICAAHSNVIPTEGYAALANDQQRMSAVVLLQQKAKALEIEIAERRKTQAALEERQAELRDFLENAVIGMHWVDEDGTILWANQAEIDLSGYERDEYVGHPISEFHTDAQVVEDMLQRLRRGETLKGYSARMRRKNGTIRQVRVDSNAFMRDGRLIHTRYFITDVTEKTVAEEGLFRLAAIVASSDDAIVSKDLNGIITSWNESAERIFGYKKTEVIGQSIIILIPPELREEETLILTKIRAGERVDHFQTVRVTKGGERIQVSLTISPVKNDLGKIVGAAKILRDITQQKKLEAALHTTEKLASVGRLAATVAHEINNPLEAVTNFVYLAKMQPEMSEETRGYLTAADRELARVAHLARQTLGFYRDTSRPVQLVVEDVIEDVLTIYELRSKYKGLNIERRLETDLTVYALQGELKQVLSNLIANAIDASREGGKIIIAARACRHLSTGGRGIKITIADDGEGIAEQDKAKLFVPFFTTKKSVGTGLGLWITKDLLEKKGGSIRFRSRNSGRTGTVMSLYLPDTEAGARTDAGN